MYKIRKMVYRCGFRPSLGSIWHSPSLNMIYAYKNFATDFKMAMTLNQQLSFERANLEDVLIVEQTKFGPLYIPAWVRAEDPEAYERAIESMFPEVRR